MGTVCVGVRPFGVPVCLFRVCWLTVIVHAIRSTSSRQRSALTSPTRSPASPASHPAAYHSGLSALADARRRVYCAKSQATISGRSTLNSPILGALAMTSQSAA